MVGEEEVYIGKVVVENVAEEDEIKEAEEVAELVDIFFFCYLKEKIR